MQRLHLAVSAPSFPPIISCRAAPSVLPLFPWWAEAFWPDYFEAGFLVASVIIVAEAIVGFYLELCITLTNLTMLALPEIIHSRGSFELLRLRERSC